MCYGLAQLQMKAEDDITRPPRSEWRELLPLQAAICLAVTVLAVWATSKVSAGLRMAHRWHRPVAVWWVLLVVTYLWVLVTYCAAVWVVRRARQRD